MQVDEYLQSKAVKLAPLLPFPAEVKVHETLCKLGKGMKDATRRAFKDHYAYRQEELGEMRVG